MIGFIHIHLKLHTLTNSTAVFAFFTFSWSTKRTTGSPSITVTHIWTREAEKFYPPRSEYIKSARCTRVIEEL